MGMLDFISDKLNVLHKSGSMPTEASKAGFHFVSMENRKAVAVVSRGVVHTLFDTENYKTKKETDDALDLKATQVEVDDHARSIDILSTTKAEKSVVDALMNGIIKQNAVNTYNTGSNSLSAVYGLTASNNGSNGKAKQNGWDVLVRNDETKGSKSNRYNWNGTQWIDMDAGVYDENVLTQEDLDKLQPTGVLQHPANLYYIGGYDNSHGNITIGSIDLFKTSSYIKNKVGDKIKIKGAYSVSSYDEDMQNREANIKYTDMQNDFAVFEFTRYGYFAINYEYSPSSLPENKIGNVNDILVAFYPLGADIVEYKADKKTFSINGYYVNRLTGALSADARYECTPPLPINKNTDLIVYGYTGGNASAYVFYDADFNYVSYDYPTTPAGMDVHTVSKNDIPSNAVYVRATSLVTADGYVTGVLMGMGDILEELHTLKKDLEIYNVTLKKPIAGFYTSTTARNAVPSNLRHRGLIISYLTEAGWEYEKFTGTVYSIFQSWQSLTYNIRSVICEMDGQALNKYGVEYTDQSYRGHSAYLRLSEDGIKLFNFSVLAANKVNTTDYAAVFLFDAQYNSVGYLTANAYNNVFESYTIDKSYVDANFPTAYYFRVNIYNSALFNVYYPNNVIVSKSSYIAKNESVLRGYFDIIGYTHKSTGILTDAGVSSYRTTPFMVLDSTPDITVTGFSGITNNAPLCLCFDEKLNYIGYINAPTHGRVTEYVISKASLPVGTVYVKFNRQSDQSLLLLGANIILNNIDIQKFILDNSGKIDVTDGSGVSKTEPISEFGVKQLMYNILPFNNYLGNSENIHPKVLYFENSLWNYKYWMAYTPYPLGDTLAENPCIAVSNDGVRWSVPDGLVNPLAFAPEVGYNSDTHLVYRYDTNVLECWYRPFNRTTNKDAIVRKVSMDGINWGSEEVIFDFERSSGQILSPAIIFEDGKYKMWFCRSSQVVYMETSDGTLDNWSAPVTLAISWGTLRAWHMDIINNGIDGYDMIVCAFGVGGGNNTADLYHVKQLYDNTVTQPVLIEKRSKNPNAINNRAIYRSSIVLVDGQYYIYASCIDDKWHRYLYLIEDVKFK